MSASFTATGRPAACRAALGLALATLAACGGPVDPVEELAEARARYRVEVTSFATGKPAPDGSRRAVIGVRVENRGAPLQLPCLTLDVTFFRDEQPVDTRLETIDLETMSPASGVLESTLFVQLEEIDPDGVEVALHPASGRDELAALCEGRLLPEGGGSQS